MVGHERHRPGHRAGFYREKKEELLKSHEGQFAVIKGREIVGIYPTQNEAYLVGFTKFMRAPFLVKHIVEKEPPEQVPLLALHLQRVAAIQ